MIRPERIAHVVLKVRDLERSKKFYTEVLGMDVMSEIPMPRILFLANNRRDHHEIALLEIGAQASAPPANAVGLVHVAFRLRNEEERMGSRTNKPHSGECMKRRTKTMAAAPSPWWPSRRGLTKNNDACARS